MDHLFELQEGDRIYVELPLEVWTRIDEILADYLFEIPEGDGIYVELPLEELAHLSLHLEDLAQLEHSLCDGGPELVGVGIVTYDL